MALLTLTHPSSHPPPHPLALVPVPPRAHPPRRLVRARLSPDPRPAVRHAREGTDRRVLLRLLDPRGALLRPVSCPLPNERDGNALTSLSRLRRQFVIMFGNLTGYAPRPRSPALPAQTHRFTLLSRAPSPRPRPRAPSYSFIFSPHALPPGLSGTLFLSIAAGLVCCALATPLMRRDYRRCVARAAAAAQGGEEKVQPEERLRVAVLGTWAVPAGLFWACVLRLLSLQGTGERD